MRCILWIFLSNSLSVLAWIQAPVKPPGQATLQLHIGENITELPVRIPIPFDFHTQLFFQDHRSFLQSQFQHHPPLFTHAHRQKSPFTPTFDAYAISLLSEWHIPSLTIAVVDGPHTFTRAYGFANLPSTPATPETLYFAGSTTKAFTAAAIGLLIENQSNALTWRTPISTLLREDFVLSDPYTTTHATLEDLASHRTGLPRHDFSYGDDNHTARNMLRSLRHLPLTGGFRERFQYCNVMFTALAHVVETLTSTSFGAFLTTHIWIPLGMNSTYASLADAQASDRQLATGYVYDIGTHSHTPEPYLTSPILAGAGCVVSNVLDFSLWLRSLLRRAAPLPPALHDQLRFPRIPTGPVVPGGAGPANMYTLGWTLGSFRGHEMMSHGGTLPGFGALAAAAPGLEWGVAMLSNSALEGNAAEDVLFLRLLEERLGVPEGERIGAKAWWEALFATVEYVLLHARELVYPGLPERRVEHGLPLAGYAGRYVHPGYGGFTFEVDGLVVGVPGLERGARMLHANASERAVPMGYWLEHVNGEHFLGWMVPSDRVNGSARALTTAEFRVGADGRARELGLALEAEMGGEKIWFARVDG